MRKLSVRPSAALSVSVERQAILNEASLGPVDSESWMENKDTSESSITAMNVSYALINRAPLSTSSSSYLEFDHSAESTVAESSRVSIVLHI